MCYIVYWQLRNMHRQSNFFGGGAEKIFESYVRCSPSTEKLSSKCWRGNIQYLESPLLDVLLLDRVEKRLSGTIWYINEE